MSPISHKLVSPTAGRTACPAARKTRAGAWLALTLAAVSLGACVVPRAPSPDAQPHSQTDDSGVAPYLEMMVRLGMSDPAKQADLFFAIERDYTSAPTTANSLRYALALATPNHPATNPTAAKQTLEILLATPEKMTPQERELATLMLSQTEERLRLDADNSRLLATLDGRLRAQANSDKRMQAQVEENVRLRKSLEEAQQKLDAVRDIEKRSIIERSPTPPGNTPAPGDRDPLSEAQSPPVGR